MRPSGIVAAPVSADRIACFADRSVGVEIDLLVLHQTLQTLDHNIVPPGAARGHRSPRTVHFSLPTPKTRGRAWRDVGKRDNASKIRLAFH